MAIILTVWGLCVKTSCVQLGGVPKMSTKVIEVMLKEMGIEADKLLKVMFANYLLLGGRMVSINSGGL